MTDPQKVLVVLSSILCFCWSSVLGFSCYTCNNKLGEDDSVPCKDRLEDCDGGTSACSTVVFRDFQQKLHVRKFCTPSGTPLYQYLTIFPGSAVCQNIQSQNLVPVTRGAGPSSPLAADTPLIRRPRTPVVGAHSPSALPAILSSHLKSNNRKTSSAQRNTPKESVVVDQFNNDNITKAATITNDQGAPGELPLPPAPQDIFERCNGGDWDDVLHNALMNNIVETPMEKHATKVEKFHGADQLNRIDLQKSAAGFAFA